MTLLGGCCGVNVLAATPAQEVEKSSRDEEVPTRREIELLVDGLRDCDEWASPLRKANNSIETQRDALEYLSKLLRTQTDGALALCPDTPYQDDVNNSQEGQYHYEPPPTPLTCQQQLLKFVFDEDDHKHLLALEIIVNSNFELLPQDVAPAIQNGLAWKLKQIQALGETQEHAQGHESPASVSRKVLQKFLSKVGGRMIYPEKYEEPPRQAVLPSDQTTFVGSKLSGRSLALFSRRPPPQSTAAKSAQPHKADDRELLKVAIMTAAKEAGIIKAEEAMRSHDVQKALRDGQGVAQTDKVSRVGAPGGLGLAGTTSVV